MSARPSQPLALFTDRDLGRLIWRALRDAGADVEAHDDVFPAQDTPDVDWISYTARVGRVALTKNKYIRYTPAEFDCVLSTGARVAGEPIRPGLGHWR
jgi:hypothetical protein